MWQLTRDIVKWQIPLTSISLHWQLKDDRFLFQILKEDLLERWIFLTEKTNLEGTSFRNERIHLKSQPTWKIDLCKRLIYLWDRPISEVDKPKRLIYLKTQIYLKDGSIKKMDLHKSEIFLKMDLPKRRVNLKGGSTKKNSLPKRCMYLKRKIYLEDRFISEDLLKRWIHLKNWSN